jgi:membrane-associated phospholipid phosphatase
LQAIWVFVTDCGDSAVTVPLALLTLIFLVAAGQRRLAFAWILTISGCAAAIAVLKLGFGACGQHLPIVHIVSPSGHTAMSTVVYGSLALLISAQLSVFRRRILYVTATVAVVGIALSRLMLHNHDLAEIAVGFCIGVGAVAIFRAMLRRSEIPVLPLGSLLLSGAAFIAVMHGTRWIIEPTVHHFAGLFRRVLPGCQ